MDYWWNTESSGPLTNISKGVSCDCIAHHSPRSPPLCPAMASPPWVRLVLILLAGVAACHARPLFDGDAVIDEMTQLLRPSMISCSTAGNYTDGSKYQVNLDRLLSAIPVDADPNGFFNGTFGAAGDEVFGMFMCYAGDTDSECQDCLTRAPEGIMKVCPHSRTVRAVYNACTIQYSDESFFSVADPLCGSHGRPFRRAPAGTNPLPNLEQQKPWRLVPRSRTRRVHRGHCRYEPHKV